MPSDQDPNKFNRHDPNIDFITRVIGILAEYEKEQVDATQDVNIFGRLFSFNKNLKGAGHARATEYRKSLKRYVEVDDDKLLITKVYNDCKAAIDNRASPLGGSSDLRERLVEALLDQFKVSRADRAAAHQEAVKPYTTAGGSGYGSSVPAVGIATKRAAMLLIATRMLRNKIPLDMPVVDAKSEVDKDDVELKSCHRPGSSSSSSDK